MSYDIELVGDPCPTCGVRPQTPSRINPTYNLAPMFVLALGLENGVRGLEGMTARESQPLLAAAVEKINDPMLREKFEELTPANGWGDVDGARKTLETMLTWSCSYPACKWRI